MTAPGVDRRVLTLARMLEEAEALGLRPFVVGPSPVCDAEQTARIGYRSLIERYSA